MEPQIKSLAFFIEVHESQKYIILNGEDPVVLDLINNKPTSIQFNPPDVILKNSNAEFKLEDFFIKNEGILDSPKENLCVIAYKEGSLQHIFSFDFIESAL